MHLFKIVLVSLFIAFTMCCSAADGYVIASSPKYEIRAVWLTTLQGLDWPKNKATSYETREKQKQELCDILDQLQQAKINTVLLQTRVRGTTIYPSMLETWDGALTGVAGRDPGYDPLQFAIDECHKRGMEIHAWLVTIPCFKTTEARLLGANSVLKRHPELCKKHEDTWYLDPGLPGTINYLSSLCAEITANYDIDGIHFDYIRYPENATRFPDQATYKIYGSGLPKTEWRRNNITECVRAMYNTVKSIKPWVKVSSSPIGKYRNLSRYSSGGWNAYHAVHQDAQLWLEEGIHDALFPMMYFQGDNFYPFAYDWHENSNGRFIVPGLGIYFLSPQEKNWELNVVTRKLNVIRTVGTQGACYFRSKFLTDNVKGLYDYLCRNYYTELALIPPMTWQDANPPTAPTSLVRTESLLTWSPSYDNLSGAQVHYNIYASYKYPVDTNDSRNLIAVRQKECRFELPAQWRTKGYFAITATDRCGNESEAISTPYQQKELLQLVHDGMEIELPPSRAEYMIISTLSGKIIRTYRYATTLKIAGLPKGFYEVRTLEKRGLSRRVGTFIK